ncbi:unnamed protein product [Chrysoparadoxa australica]
MATEFKRTVNEVEAMLEMIQGLGLGNEDPRDEATKLQGIKELVEDESSKLMVSMAKFEKRLTEKDPVTGDFRYGEGMREKVSDLKRLLDTVLTSIGPAEERVEARRRGVTAEEALRIEEERRKREEERLREAEES